MSDIHYTRELPEVTFPINFKSTDQYQQKTPA